jgi:hypothetical protein
MLQCSSYVPECDEKLKPKVGMIFEGIEAVEEFYKSYAHPMGFGVRDAQQKKLQNAVVRTKRFLCNREGFKEKGNENVYPLKKRNKMKSSRCGCQAHIFVRLCGDNTYKIDSWVE